MFCPNCGDETPDGSLFCGSCGAKIASEGGDKASQNSREGSQDAPTVPSAQSGASSGSSNKLKELVATKKGKGIIGGCAVAAVLVIALISFGASAASNVPEDIAKQSVQGSSFANNGIASNNYVEASSYSLDEFKIDKQEDVNIGALSSLFATGTAGKDKARHVMFSGKIKNDYFETSFTGESYYVKQGDNWVLASGPTISDSNTKPLQGVASLNGTSTHFYSSDASYSVSNFSSTLDENNGSYTSEATQDVEYDFWFGKDTAKNTQDFTFDGTQWKPLGDVSVSETKSTFALNGKSFKSVDRGTGWNNSSVDTTITFENGTDASNITGTYSLSYSYTGSSTEYTPFSIDGPLVGSIKHEFGQNTFDIELNDATNNVTFSGGSSSSGITAGSGTTNGIGLSTKTKSVYHKSRYRDEGDVLEIYYQRFAEQV